MKPILFNTEMVKAILEGRKTTTRRINKDVYDIQYSDIYRDTNVYGSKMKCTSLTMDQYVKEYSKYHVGDILYVRETWQQLTDENGSNYIYKASGDYSDIIGLRWRPSIHMPKKAARIFLKVKSVKVEKLQDITEEGALAEGVSKHLRCKLGHSSEESEELFNFTQAKDTFKYLWNSTVNKKYLDEYGWNANPYVWVIEFEIISKEEAFKNV